jgi:linoleoyl-CoA desaturase
MGMTHAIAAVKYDKSVHRDFQRDLKTRANAYLKAQPNGRFANGWAWVRTAVLLAAFWGLWAWLALIPHALPVTLLSIVALSVATVALAYNVSHDAVHRTYSRHGWVNELLFHGTFNVFGPNAYLWRLRHRVMHHNCVNIPGLDFNIEASDILRFSPTQTWRPVHRFQHLYAPILYCVFTLHWVFIKDFKMLTIRGIGNVQGISHTPAQIAGVVAWKVFYVCMWLVVPMVMLPWVWWQILLGFVFFHAITSFLFVITFTGSHLNRGLKFVPYDGEVPHSFAEHALHTCMDFHPTSPVMGFLLGGFNAHVAHHVFPHVCSIHLPALTRIIQEAAKEHGLPYKQTTVVSLFASHFAYLYDLGRGPRDADAAYLLERG